MIDYFALALAHGLLVVALLRIAFNPRVDDESAPAPGDTQSDTRDA